MHYLNNINDNEIYKYSVEQTHLKYYNIALYERLFAMISETNITDV